MILYTTIYIYTIIWHTMIQNEIVDYVIEVSMTEWCDIE